LVIQTLRPETKKTLDTALAACPAVCMQPSRASKRAVCLHQKLHCLSCAAQGSFSHAETVYFRMIVLILPTSNPYKYSCKNSYSYCVAVSVFHKATSQLLTAYPLRKKQNQDQEMTG